MPNLGTATVTATTGPGLTVTAKVITNVKSYLVDIDKRMIFFYRDNSDPSSPMEQYALSGTVTMTTTISSGAWTITLTVA
jgi:hypothetical protein